MNARSWISRGLASLMAASLLAVGGMAIAADHADAPGALADSAADISDFYAWQTKGGDLAAIITFAPLQAAGGTAAWDADVLYGVHIDNDGDQVADHDVWIRFGQNSAGEWGVQAVIPGAAGPIEGAVGTNLTDGTNQAWAGLADDPFFMDFDGFTDTLATGAVSFDSTRDSFAGTNVNAIAVQFPISAITGGGALDLWATTSRL